MFTRPHMVGTQHHSCQLCLHNQTKSCYPLYVFHSTSHAAFFSPVIDVLHWKIQGCMHSGWSGMRVGVACRTSYGTQAVLFPRQIVNTLA